MKLPVPLVLLACLAQASLLLPAHATEITLGKEEAALAGSPRPLTDRRLGRVIFENKADCVVCGDSVYPPEPERVLQRVGGDFMNELKTQLRTNGVLARDNGPRLALTVRLVRISHDHSLGAAAQREAPMTNGGELVTSLTLVYEIRDGERLLLEQAISTRGASNSFGMLGVDAALNLALGKNLRIFLLGLKAALDPSFAPLAGKHIQTVANDNPDTRSLVGHFITGLAHVGVGTAKVLDGAVEVLGSDALASAVSQAAADSRQWQANADRAAWQGMGSISRVDNSDNVGNAAGSTVTATPTGVADAAVPATGRDTVTTAAAPALRTGYFYCSAFIDRPSPDSGVAPQFFVSGVFPLSVPAGEPWPEEMRSRWRSTVVGINARAADQPVCTHYNEEQAARDKRLQQLQQMIQARVSPAVQVHSLDWWAYHQ